MLWGAEQETPEAFPARTAAAQIDKWLRLGQRGSQPKQFCRCRPVRTVGALSPQVETPN